MLAIVPEACLKNPQPLRSRLRGTTDAARVERGLNLPVNLWVCLEFAGSAARAGGPDTLALQREARRR